MFKAFLPFFLLLLAFKPGGDKIPDELEKTSESTISATGKKNGVWLQYKNKTNHPVSKARAVYIEKVYFDDDFLVSRSNKKAPALSDFRPADSLAKAATATPALLNGKYEGLDYQGRLIAEYIYKNGILKLLSVYSYHGNNQSITHKEDFEKTYQDEPFTGYVENITPENSVGAYYHKVAKYNRRFVEYKFSYADF